MMGNRDMLSWALFLALLAVVGGDSIIPDTHILHEKRDSHHAWRRSDRIDAQALIPLRIGLAQQNLEDGTAYERLMEVSHPESPKYGQFLSADEVHRMFEPSEEASTEVIEWLTKAGIKPNEILQYQSKAWLAAHIPAEKFEQLFHATLHEYEHETTGDMKIGCDEYHLPQHIRRHIDYITPGVAMSARVRRRNVKRSISEEDVLDRRALHYSHMGLEEASTEDASPINAADLRKDLDDCGRNITTACLRALYGLPKPTRNDSVNSLGIFENYYAWSQEDLDEFFTLKYPEIPNGTHPKFVSVDGGEGPFNRTDKHSGTEPEIDIQVPWPLIYPQTMTVYQSDDGPQAEMEINNTLHGYLNTFLDSFDGSYCKYCAFGICGDSPGLDAVYPDRLPGGFDKPQQCGTYNLTRVLSISYGEGEQDLPVAYQRRQCNEFMKLALQGHTIIASSGDFGVASYPTDGGSNGCLSGCGFNDTFYKPGENCPYQDLRGKIFHPTNPGNCPYILSVGGTTLYSNQTILDAESALNIKSSANDTSSSSGGFSNFFPRPKYQKKALDEYFREHDPGYKYYFADGNVTNIGNNEGIYNRGGRGFPDVAANGNNFRGIKWRKTNTTKEGFRTDARFYGTSVSAPIWGAVITLINMERTAVGKGPVGFVNPVLYEHPEVFNDITNGTNPGCNTTGFTAVKGWDPLTGLGTPNYPKLLEVFMKLP